MIGNFFKTARFKKVFIGFIRDLSKNVLMGITLGVVLAMLLNKEGALEKKLSLIVTVIIIGFLSIFAYFKSHLCKAN